MENQREYGTFTGNDILISLRGQCTFKSTKEELFAVTVMRCDMPMHEPNTAATRMDGPNEHQDNILNPIIAVFSYEAETIND